MYETVNEYINKGDIPSAIEKCSSYKNLKTLLYNILPFYHYEYDEELYEKVIPLIRVKLYCNWKSSEELCNLWNKMSKGNYTWNNIQICWNKPYDYQVIINSPNSTEEDEFELNKTIVFQMEPHMDKHPEQWGYWANPNVEKFFKVFKHNTDYNNCEWHLSKTYNELSNEIIIKSQNNNISTILSSKYYDPGHKKRIDFVKFLDTKNDVNVDVYGQNVYYKNYKGSLPYHEKDNGLFPYKYTFNVENFQINNYFTEKIIDAILAECLIFYNGPKNILDYFDSKSFVFLDLEDFEYDYNIIKKAIEEDWWFHRLPYIKKEKEKILNQYQFFPRLEKLLNK